MPNMNTVNYNLSGIDKVTETPTSGELLMNRQQFLTPATQEEAAPDASATGSTQNHSDSEEHVTAVTGFDATAIAVATHDD